MDCEMCAGPCQLLGFTPYIDHWRCRNCGWTFSTTANKESEPSENDENNEQ